MKKLPISVAALSLLSTLFTDPVPGIRLGLQYANTRDTYVNGIFAINYRVQVSGFFIF